MASHPVERLIVRVEGPFAVVRACKLCKFVHSRPKLQGTGRGTGMREGNKQRGILIQHIKAEHPAEYAAAMNLHNSDKDN